MPTEKPIEILVADDLLAADTDPFELLRMKRKQFEKELSRHLEPIREDMKRPTSEVRVTYINEVSTLKKRSLKQNGISSPLITSGRTGRTPA